MISREPPAYSQDTEMMLLFAQQSLAKIAKHSPDKIEDDHRSVVFAMFSAVALQHFHAILILCRDRSTPATATALFRPLVEAIVRAHWLWTSPSMDTVEAFLSDPSFEFAGFRRLAREVGKRTDLTEFFQPFIDGYGIMCDYTHTGVEQISKHFTARVGIGPNQSDEWIRMILRESCKLAIFHFILACRYAGHTDGALALQEWSNGIPS